MLVLVMRCYSPSYVSPSYERSIAVRQHMKTQGSTSQI